MSSSKARTTRKTTTKSTMGRKTARKTPAKTATKTATKAAAPKAVSAPAPAPEAASVLDQAKAVASTAPAPEPKVVTELKPEVSAPAMRKKALIEEVTRRSGVKRRDAKAAIEATLETLGEAIGAGRELNLPGFGKLKVTRSKAMSNGDVFTARIRQPKAGDKGPEEGPKDPLADAAE